MAKSKVKKVLAGIGLAAFVAGVSLSSSGCICCKHKKTGSCGSKMEKSQKSSCSGGDVKKEKSSCSAGTKSDDTKAPAKE